MRALVAMAVGLAMVVGAPALARDQVPAETRDLNWTARCRRAATSGCCRPCRTVSTRRSRTTDEPAPQDQALRPRPAGRPPAVGPRLHSAPLLHREGAELGRRLAAQSTTRCARPSASSAAPGASSSASSGSTATGPTRPTARWRAVGRSPSRRPIGRPADLLSFGLLSPLAAALAAGRRCAGPTAKGGPAGDFDF